MWPLTADEERRRLEAAQAALDRRLAASVADPPGTLGEIREELALRPSAIPILERSERWDTAEMFAAVLLIKATAASSIDLVVERRNGEEWESKHPPGSPAGRLQRLLDEGTLMDDPPYMPIERPTTTGPLRVPMFSPARTLIFDALCSHDVAGRVLIHMEPMVSRAPGARRPMIGNLRYLAPRSPQISAGRLVTTQYWGHDARPIEEMMIWERVDPVNGSRLYSSWAGLSRTITGERLAQEWQTASYRRGVRKDGLLTPPKDTVWEPNEFDAVVKLIQGDSGPDAAGGIAITNIPGDLKLFEGTSTREMDWVNSRREHLLAICARLGVPISMVVHDAKYSNAVQGRASMWQDRLGPWVSLFAEELSRALCPAFGRPGELRIVAEWQHTQAALGDIAPRAAAFASLRQAGVPYNDAATAAGLSLPPHDEDEVAAPIRTMSIQANMQRPHIAAPRARAALPPVRFAMEQAERDELTEKQDSAVAEIALLLATLGDRLGLTETEVRKRLDSVFPGTEIVGGVAALEDAVGPVLEGIVGEWYELGLERAGLAIDATATEAYVANWRRETGGEIFARIVAGVDEAAIRLAPGETRDAVEASGFKAESLFLLLLGLDATAARSVLNRIERQALADEAAVREAAEGALQVKADGLGRSETWGSLWAAQLLATEEPWRWLLDGACNHCPVCLRLAELPARRRGELFVDPATGIGYAHAPAHPRCCCSMG